MVVKVYEAVELDTTIKYLCTMRYDARGKWGVTKKF